MSEGLLDLTGRRILISGGCGALGRAIVTLLAAHGAAVAVNDVVTAEEAAAAVPGAAAYLPGAVRTPEEARALVASAAGALGGPPDAVLCHAGKVASHPVDEYPMDVFDDLVETNLRGSFVLAQAAAAAWRAAGTPGHLVFTSSWVARVPWPGIAPYSATKAALEALTRSFARELAPRGIRANAVAPGIVGAGMAQRQWDTEPDYRARAGKAIPLGRLQDVESVANAFLFLCSPMAEYMTGSVLVVDGGAGLYPMD
jgi:NAD(P)-dependent dehydrogenase (short-subunit alcohol dehydrogenase family)